MHPDAPPPPQRKGTNGSVGYPLYSNLLATSIFIEIPAWKHSLLSSLLDAWDVSVRGCLQLSNRNSIPMTESLSRIWSGAPIGLRSS